MIVVPSLKRAGAERQAVDLANGLNSRGHDVTMCTLEREVDQRIDLSPDIRFYQFARRARFDLQPMYEIAKVIDRERIEVVQGILQFAALIGQGASWQSRAKPPVVAAVHTTKNISLKAELQDRFLYRHFLRRAPAVVFVCQHQRDYWVQKYPELQEIARVVHNGIDAAKYQRSPFIEAAADVRKSLHISSDDFVFTCVAAFRKEKGHDVLIKAFGKMPQNAHLILAGDGVLKSRFERAIHEGALSQRVHFLGTVTDVRPIIAASDATVLASTAVETFSIAMLESMAMEVPMIASDVGGLAEAIYPNKTGLLAKPGNPESLGSQMFFAIKNPAILKQMGKAAARLVRAHYTLDRMTDANEALLNDARRCCPR